MDKSRYNKIARNLSTRDITNTVKPSIPTPTESDYERGYIVRYFVQLLTNKSAPVYEVNGTGFSKFSSNPYYNGVQIDWRLTGKREDVKESNKRSIQIVSPIIPRLKLYLPNLVQFYDPSYYTEPTPERPEKEIDEEVKRRRQLTSPTGSAFENNQDVSTEIPIEPEDGLYETTTISPTLSSTFGTFDTLDEGNFNSGSTYIISGSDSRAFGNTSFITDIPYISFGRNAGSANFVESGTTNFIVEESNWNFELDIRNGANENGSLSFYFPSVNGTGYNITEPLNWSTGLKTFSENLSGPYDEQLNSSNTANSLRREFIDKPSTFTVSNSDIAWEFDYSAKILFLDHTFAQIETNEFAGQTITEVEDYIAPPPSPSSVQGDTINAPFVNVSWNQSTFGTSLTLVGHNVYIDGNKYNDSVISAGTNELDVVLADGTYDIKVTGVWNDGVTNSELTETTITGVEVTGFFERVVEGQDDFESYAVGDVPTNFINDLTGGSEPNKYGWFVDDTRANGGTNSLASSVDQVGVDNSHSRILLPISVDVNSELKFDYFLSSEGSSFDNVRILVDNVEVVDGRVIETWTELSHTLSAGDYVVAIEFIKDSIIGDLDDRCWIDNFSLLPV